MVTGFVQSDVVGNGWIEVSLQPGVPDCLEGDLQTRHAVFQR